MMEGLPTIQHLGCIIRKSDGAAFAISLVKAR